MATADVKLSLYPSEFDAVRKALTAFVHDRLDFAERKGMYEDQPIDAAGSAARREAREQSARAALLLNKLNV